MFMALHEANCTLFVVMTQCVPFLEYAYAFRHWRLCLF